MVTNTNMEIQNKKSAKVLNLYNLIKNDFYLCRNDIRIGGDEFNSSLLFGVLTELNRGKQLLYGEYGGGKTTSAEYLHSIFNAIPIDIVKRVVIRGNPHLTQEKMIGRPDYGRMHQGFEDVVWQNFVLIPQKIVDEFNRIPESNQSMLLDGLDRGEWNYLNAHISQGDTAFFATCNYEDGGNNTLIPPLLDRFDIATESRFPGVANSITIGYNFHNSADYTLKNPEITKNILDLLLSKKPYEDVRKELNDITDEFRIHLKKNSLETLTREELIEVDSEIGSIPLSSSAVAYLSFLISELNIHPKYGQKRSNDPISKDEGPYLYNLVKGSGSRRQDKSIVRYAQSLAWLQNKEEANLEHVLTVAPYALWHRLRLTDDTMLKLKDNKRNEPLALYAVKTLLNDGTNELPGVKKRLLESGKNYGTVMNFIMKGEVENARNAASSYSINGKGHPIFLDLAEELS